MTSKLVKKTAKELAGAFFNNEDALNDNRHQRTDEFRSSGITEQQFIATYWPDFVKMARKILAHMLNDPGRSQSEKDQIFDALLEERGQLNDEQLAAPSIVRLH